MATLPVEVLELGHLVLDPGLPPRQAGQEGGQERVQPSRVCHRVLQCHRGGLSHLGDRDVNEMEVNIWLCQKNLARALNNIHKRSINRKYLSMYIEERPT